MRMISLKLPETLLEQSKRLAETLHLSRAEYIRRAIEQKNLETEAALRAKRIAAASPRVRHESLRVNAEFEKLESEPDA